MIALGVTLNTPLKPSNVTLSTWAIAWFAKLTDETITDCRGAVGVLDTPPAAPLATSPQP